MRELDPATLLAREPPGGNLQPYVPRAVDTKLDQALGLPGLVVIVFASGAGARRSAVEALRRNLPDAFLYLPARASEQMDTAHSDAVLWVDPGRSGRMSTGYLVGLLRRWFADARRSAVVLVSVQNASVDAFNEFSPTVVHMSGQLTESERAAANRRGLDDDVRTVTEMAAQPTSAAPPEAEAASAAGYRADTTDGPDRLGITDDVNMLADLIASRLVGPPLSVGLFGKWGSGKSFFMRQMRRRVELLAFAARSAEKAQDRRGPDVTSYCSSIRQIDFNAWHYVEANLWASLATHIFDQLAGETTDDELARLDEKRTSESLLDQLSAVRVKRRLVAARGAPIRLRGEDLAWVAQEVGVPSATADDVLTFARRLRGFGAKARLLARSPWTWVSLGVGAALAAGLAFLVQSAVWPVALGVVPVLAVAARVLARVARIQEAAETRTNQQLAELDAEADRLERAIAEMAPGQDVTAFARARHAGYQQHLGVVSLLRKDLETFAHLLANDADGPERVVLYIDDLDRCPPDVVIKVLEAVHLLVALPVFVVVVGVDPRWLHQAIRHHYASVLPDAEITPTDYLEKIFQIPFQLSPMDAQGFSGLVQELAGSGGPAPIPVTAEEETALGDGALEPASPAPVQAWLRPRQLTVTQEEVDFLGSLARYVPSPREAKRVTNLYRLVRARLSGPELDEFLAGDDFRAVLVLLAAAEKDVDLPQEVYEKWLPLVRRFSFGEANGPRAESGGRSSVH